MQVLFVSAEYGWPTNTGYRQRLRNTAHALLELGELTWVVCAPGPDHGPPPDDLPVDLHVVRLERSSGGLDKLRWPVTPHPWRLHTLELDSMRRSIRTELAARGPFDLVLACQLEAWAVIEPLLGELVAPGGVHALDIDDVESEKVRRRAATMWRAGDVGSRARSLALRFDARRWQRVIDRAVATTITFTASELDRKRLGGRPIVLRNVVPEPEPGYVRAPGPTPVLLFVGSLTYEPNIDGLEHFVAEVLPAVRAEVPDAVLRIVGQGRSARAEALAATPGVQLVGEVASVGPELAAANLAVVPVRFGGGTRIKILEALAHGVPVVSTTAGAEGLAVVDGEHLLLADAPTAFADACVRLLLDRPTADRLAARGTELLAAHRAPVVRRTLIDALRPPQAG